MTTATWSSAGTYQWLCPAGVTSVQAECWGSGAGGQWSSGPGGAGGNYSKSTGIAVTPGHTYTVTVGAGGAGGTSSSGYGKHGNDSSFSGDSVTVAAHGGGTNNTSPSPKGATGTGSTNFLAGNCTDSGGLSIGGGGGGSSCGTGSAGGNGSAHSGGTGGAGGTATGAGSGGHGGNGGSSSTAGSAGSSPGGGGGSGGSTSSGGSNGGAGADGQVRLTYQSAITSSGSASLSGMSLAAAASGGNTTASGSMSLAGMGTAGTVTQVLSESGGMDLGFLSMAASGLIAPTFPAQVLGITAELLVNGTWTDISGYIYQRYDIVISLGRPNETTQIQPGSMTLTLDNRTGEFSPQNPNGLLYPYITRNMQIRLSVLSASSSGVVYNGYRYWGEVSEWPPQWDVTGNDMYIHISANGVLTRYLQGGLIGSALKRFYLLKTDVTAPVALWTCEDQTGSSQFTSALASGYAMTWTGTPSLASDSDFSGTDPLPLIQGSTWTGLTGSYSSAGPVTWKTPGTYSWTCPGDVSSLTTAEAWGGGGGGANARANDANTGGGAGGGGEYAKETSVAVTPGTEYTVIVGAGGQGGYFSEVGGGQKPGSNGGLSSFSGDSVTVTANGGQGGSDNSGGAGGTGSSNTTHHSGGAGASHSGTGAGHYGGAGGGSSAGSSAAGSNGSANGGSNAGGAGGSAPSGGGAGGKGGPGGTLQTSPKVSRGGLGSVPGGGGGGGGEATSDFDGFAGGSGGSGQVKLNWTSSTTPNNVVVRFLLDIPAAGIATSAPIVRADIASGSLTYIEVYSGTSATDGKLGMRGYNGATKEFDTGLQPFGAAGQPLMVTMELAVHGTGIAWNLDAIEPGADSTVGGGQYNGVYASSTIGAVDEIIVNSGGTIQDTCVGVIVLQYAYEPLTAVSDAVGGHSGELAADRISRLCSEEGFGFELIGNASDTPEMGPQIDAKFTDLLQYVEDADQGQVFESIDQFGLGYRTRVSMQNQSADLTLDYSLSHLSAVPLPVYDVQQTRNDVTVSRYNGGSVTVQDTTDALSVLTPPDGVGDYPYSPTVYLNADTQLPGIATWILAKGTVDEYRYPQVTVSMTRSEVASLFSDVPSLQIGDYAAIVNMPSSVPSTVSQLQWGRTETLNALRWDFTFNNVPESPYEGADLPTW